MTPLDHREDWQLAVWSGLKSETGIKLSFHLRRLPEEFKEAALRRMETGFDRRVWHELAK